MLATCKPCNTDVKINDIRKSKVSKVQMKYTPPPWFDTQMAHPEITIVEIKNVMGIWLWRKHIMNV